PMNELIIYGICLAVAIGLLIGVAWRKGLQVLLPLIMLPPLLAGLVTRDGTDLFATNGGGTKSVTRVFTNLFALLLVLLLGLVPYGVYRAGAWLIATEIAWRTGPLAPAAGTLLTFNTLLWLLSAALVMLLLTHLGQCWQWIMGMNNTRILFGYATPLLMHGLAFVVLTATRNHLLHSPGTGTWPGYGAAAAAIGCANLLVFTLVRNLLGYKTLLGQVQVPADLTLKLFRTLSLLHAVLFGYFLVRVFLAV
ncbi:MAG: hypothetical protein ICV83_02525, partial [Cytophagales bacterium]|nr:hypothetical protein [Cytophagales bacterium]